MTDKPKGQRFAVERRLGIARHLRNDWVFDAEEGTPIERILEPDYWSPIASKFSHFDRIEVRIETGKWIAELVVRDKALNWARVALLKLHEFDKEEDETPVSALHEVFWRGPHHKYAVRRLSDQEVVQNGFSDKAAADAWVAARERMMLMDRAA